MTMDTIWTVICIALALAGFVFSMTLGAWVVEHGHKPESDRSRFWKILFLAVTFTTAAIVVRP